MIEETQYDIIPLPSKGLFYHNGCDKVKVYHMTMADEEILTSLNLIENNGVIDELLKRKVRPVEDGAPFIDTQKMLLGDRFALLIFIRITMTPIYRMTLYDSRNEPVEIDFDLGQLKVKESPHLPNEKKEFEFTLPKTGKIVTFRLMTGEDEKNLRLSGLKKKNQLIIDNIGKLELLVTSVDGERDKGNIYAFLRRLPIMDGRALLDYVEEVTPTLDLNIEIPHPKRQGEFIKDAFSYNNEFFFPSTYG
jgi:hypothetical protein